MRAEAPRPVGDRWSDVEGNHISLFSLVEQVVEDPEPGMLSSRLHQHGQVVGRSLDSFYVLFTDNQVIGLPPHLLRLLPDEPGRPAHRERP